MTPTGRSVPDERGVGGPGDGVVALVLAGGGTKAAFEAGAVLYLVEEQGPVPEVITAASAGSVARRCWPRLATWASSMPALAQRDCPTIRRRQAEGGHRGRRADTGTVDDWAVAHRVRPLP